MPLHVRRPSLLYTPSVPQSFTIAHLSDIHCGDAHFVPDLMERAIADINALCPDIVICSGDLTTFGFKEEYAQAKRYLDRLDVRVVRRHPREPRLAQRRLRPLRGAVRRPQLGAAQGRDQRRRRRLDRARPRPRPDRPRPLRAGSRSSSRAPADMRIFVLHHHLLPVPGHRPRAQHRLRRRRRDRVPAARGREPRPFRAQARSLCVAAREPVRGQHRHRLVACGSAARRGPVTT